MYKLNKHYLEQLRLLYNRDIFNATERLSQAWRPYSDLEVKLDIRLPDFQRSMSEPMRLFAELQATMAGSFKPFEDLQERIAESLKPLDELKYRMSDQLMIYDRIATNERMNYQSMIEKITISLAPMYPASEVMTKIMETWQQRTEQMLQNIPQSVFMNVELANIRMQYYNELISDVTSSVNDTDLSPLTEEEIQEVTSIINNASEGNTVSFDQFLNKLLEYAKVAGPRLKLFIVDVANKAIVAYMAAVMLTICSPESLGLLTKSKSEVVQQVSQEMVNKYHKDELSQYRLVKVNELNIRSSPSIDAPILSGLSLGDVVKIHKIQDEWILVEWGGNEGVIVKGWVKKRYLTVPKLADGK